MKVSVCVEAMVYEYHGVSIRWIGHDGFIISNGVKILIDPYKTNIEEKADLILISHGHFDHLSLDDLKKFVSYDTIIVAPKPCVQQLSTLNVKETIGVSPGERVKAGGMDINTIAAYNLNKFMQAGKVFHPRQDGGLGFIFTIDGVTIYHAGDTDHIPEMQDLDVDIALLPVSGTYVMTAEEASQAAVDIKTKIAIPMHYGTIVGDVGDANRFKVLASCEVHVLTVD